MKKRKYLRILSAFILCAFLTFSLLACTEPTDPEAPPSSNSGKPRVAFTFDDGPTPGVTEKILDKLESIGGRATFFQVGNRHNFVENSVYRRISELGCEVGSHTFSHPNGFASLSQSATRGQLEDSLEAISSDFSGSIRLFRPVGGDSTAAQRQLAADMGLHTVCWSIDTEDWREQTNNVSKVEDFIDEKVRHILNNVEDGDIILMHELYLSSYEIFSRAADELTERGFELVTVSEILGLTASTKPTSTVYRKGDPIFSEDAVG